MYRRAHERKQLARLPVMAPNDMASVEEVKRNRRRSTITSLYWDVDAEAQTIEEQLLLILLPRSFAAIANAQLNLGDALAAAELYSLSDVPPKYVLSSAPLVSCLTICNVCDKGMY
jgi:hypothetical protein